MLQADLETQQQEQAAKLTSESEKEASIASPLKEQEPVSQAPTEKKNEETGKSISSEKNPETSKISEKQVSGPSAVKVFHSDTYNLQRQIADHFSQTNTLYLQVQKEVEVVEELPTQSSQHMEIDKASRASSQEKIPETAQVSVRQTSEPPTKVIDISDI